MTLTGIFSSANLSKRQIGSAGENIAAAYLKRHGYKIIERNFSVHKVGEIDIIARDGEYLCFVEVRLRSRDDYGTPAETVNYAKQKRLIRAAEVYLAKNDLTQALVRFDVAEVYGGKNSAKTVLIKDAFWAK